MVALSLRVTDTPAVHEMHDDEDEEEEDEASIDPKGEMMHLRPQHVVETLSLIDLCLHSGCNARLVKNESTGDKRTLRNV